MSISIQLTEREKELASSYAKMQGMSLSEAFKSALFEKIEDEFDVKLADKSYAAYLRDPKTYSHQDVKAILGIK